MAYKIGNFGVTPTEGSGNGALQVSAKPLASGNGDHQRIIYLKSTDGTRTATIILKQKDPAQQRDIEFRLTYYVDNTGKLIGTLKATENGAAVVSLPETRNLYIVLIANSIINGNSKIYIDSYYIVPTSVNDQNIEVAGFVNQDHLQNQDYEIDLSFSNQIGGDPVNIYTGADFQYSCGAEIDENAPVNTGGNSGE